ncbi:uncharacterized protein [Periplaneta americana]|uniref:uncharacterized protein n=1 Tax=Periplaneta americana TaxID=6978 RepID=UPI0037E8D392
MDVIKMEREIDPLAIEEEKTLSEKGNILDLQLTGIKAECVDHSYDVKTDMTFDETPVPVDFLFMKSEVGEEAREINKVEEEVKLEVTAEEDEVLTEGCRCVGGRPTCTGARLWRTDSAN